LKTFAWSAATLSDTGRVRSGNEDSTYANLDSGVFVVADGMGGRAAGEIASGIASQCIGAAASEAAGSIDELRESLVAAFLAAGDEIARRASVDPVRSGMGTTCTALMLRDRGDYLVGHIGDSRAYLHRGGALRRVTRDHSWVQDQVDRGLIKPEEARGHPSSNLITRAIGIDPEPKPDIYTGSLQEGDVFLLTSDGLTDMVDERRIAELLASDEASEEVAERFISEANEAGGTDNITALLVRVRRLER
jgi:protein phosphatase